MSHSTMQEPVCETVGCEHDATVFESDALEFRCDEHKSEERLVWVCSGTSGEERMSQS
jgi:hypothetical protein